MNAALITNQLLLENTLNEFKEKGIKSVLVFCAQKTVEDFEGIYLPILKRSGFLFFGGVFPSLIYQSSSREDGCLIIGFQEAIDYEVFSLENSEELLDAKMTAFKTTTKVSTPQSVFILVSAFGSDKSIFLKTIFNNYGNQVNYFGAGCGDLSFKDIPCIITNQGMHQNKGIIAEFPLAFKLHYTHGWTAFEKSYKVTQTEGNEIITLDWRPALEVYIEALLEHTGRKLTFKNFDCYIKSYPFGILRMDSELIIRDPYTTTERGGVKVVDKIEDGEYIRIMNGDAESLIKATAQLSKVSANKIEASQAYFSFNCISRKLFLKEKINEELEQLCPSNLIGAFTIGEIVNEGKTYLEMYNKIIAKITI